MLLWGKARVEVEPQFEATTRSQSCDRDQTKCNIVRTIEWNDNKLTERFAWCVPLWMK